jgi:hypothetical protein
MQENKFIGEWILQAEKSEYGSNLAEDKSFYVYRCCAGKF